MKITLPKLIHPKITVHSLAQKNIRGRELMGDVKHHRMQKMFDTGIQRSLLYGKKPHKHIPFTVEYMTEEQIIEREKDFAKVQKENKKDMTGALSLKPTTSIVGMNDYPTKPTQKHFAKYRENRKQILEPLVEKSAKKHNSVMHGRHNVNFWFEHLLGSKIAKEKGFVKDTYDYDVWVYDAKKRAVDMQHQIDSAVGADIAYAKKEVSPKETLSRWVVHIKDKQDKPKMLMRSDERTPAQSCCRQAG